MLQGSLTKRWTLTLGLPLSWIGQMRDKTLRGSKHTVSHFCGQTTGSQDGLSPEGVTRPGRPTPRWLQCLEFFTIWASLKLLGSAETRPGVWSRVNGSRQRGQQEAITTFNDSAFEVELALSSLFEGCESPARPVFQELPSLLGGLLETHV